MSKIVLVTEGDAYFRLRRIQSAVLAAPSASTISAMLLPASLAVLRRSFFALGQRNELVLFYLLFM